MGMSTEGAATGGRMPHVPINGADWTEARA